MYIVVDDLSFVYMGQSIQEWPSKICGRQSVKNFTWSILEYFVPYIFLLTSFGFSKFI